MSEHVRAVLKRHISGQKYITKSAIWMDRDFNSQFNTFGDPMSCKI